ncbi:EamA family transporter [Candidatus Woesearchaeota archaeon]|nr:EamA family transporter [Candidatus Woesearchaeota archaeon]
MDWYWLSLIVLFCYGMQYFLYKVAAEKRCNTAWVSFTFMLTVGVLATTMFLFLQESVVDWPLMIIFSLVNAVIFLLTTITRMESLKHIPASISFPLVRMSTVFVVIFSLVYFKDKLSPYQAIGILVAIMAVYLLTRYDKAAGATDKRYGLGLALAIIAIFSGAVSTIIQKFAALAINKLAYMATTNYMNTFFSLGLRKKLQTKKENPNHANAVAIGVGIGIVNFLGFYFVLQAFEKGPLSLVAALTSLSFVIAIILSIIIYREKLTWKTVWGIALSIAAILLLGM